MLPEKNVESILAKPNPSTTHARILIIVDMCRTGQTIPKQHVSCWWDITEQADSARQAGARMFGYDHTEESWSSLCIIMTPKQEARIRGVVDQNEYAREGCKNTSTQFVRKSRLQPAEALQMGSERKRRLVHPPFRLCNRVDGENTPVTFKTGPENAKEIFSFLSGAKTDPANAEAVPSIELLERTFGIESTQLERPDLQADAGPRQRHSVRPQSGVMWQMDDILLSSVNSQLRGGKRRNRLVRSILKFMSEARQLAATSDAVQTAVRKISGKFANMQPYRYGGEGHKLMADDWKGRNPSYSSMKMAFVYVDERPEKNLWTAENPKPSYATDFKHGDVWAFILSTQDENDLWVPTVEPKEICKVTSTNPSLAVESDTTDDDEDEDDYETLQRESKRGRLD